MGKRRKGGDGLKNAEKWVKQAGAEVGRGNYRPNVRSTLFAPKNAKNKYRNVKVQFDGLLFDSQKEATRWAELKLLQRTGQIYELRRQVAFEIIPTQHDKATGELVERCARYIADFVYRERSTGKIVVEDTKSDATKTPEYVLKRKLMYYRFGIRIKEV
jgi:hypothetical protein